jgi:hypothetical protein
MASSSWSARRRRRSCRTWPERRRLAGLAPVPSAPPLPPLELITRVGTVQGADPFQFYEREGAAVRARARAGR